MWRSDYDIEPVYLGQKVPESEENLSIKGGSQFTFWLTYRGAVRKAAHVMDNTV